MTKVYCEILEKECELKSETKCKKCIEENIPNYFSDWRR